MIDKFAGLPTQIRQLEKRLKDMDGSKVKPALIKEITDTIKNLKDMLKEKQEKKEQRKKEKEQVSTEEVSKEAISIPNAANIGAVAPNTVAPTNVPGSPEATPSSADDNKVSCPLCGGMTFNDQAAYQQHMEFTHASDIMPTVPGQKLEKTVAAIEPTPEVAPAAISEDKGPQFKLDAVVKPIRGSESTGKVMRWDGKPNDLVFVAWESGPLKERDTFGGYYPHDLQLVEEKPVEAAMPAHEPVCQKCIDTQDKQGDLKTNYEALLKDLQEEHDLHYTQGNNAWATRLEQKIIDLKNQMAEKFPEQKDAAIDMTKSPECKQNKHKDCRNMICQCPHHFDGTKKEAIGGPELIRQINKAVSGHGYESTIYNLTNGRFQQNVPLKINETNVRMKQPENGTFELKYPGQEWRPVLQPEFEQWLEQWKEINQKNNQKEGATERVVRDPWPAGVGGQVKHKPGVCKYCGWYYPGILGHCTNCGNSNPTSKQAAAENAEELTIMDHTPPRANTSADEGGKDTHDEFQDEWAMPLTSATKINVFKRELLATPSSKGYDISHEGKKLFNITGKDNKPMNRKQLEFCTQIELTRGMKQAKLVEKIAFLEAGSKVYITAADKTRRRVKFASMEHGLRGWISDSKVKLIALESQPVNHNGHSDKVLGASGSETLLDCVESGPIWVSSTELLDNNRPPATPESLNDFEDCTNCVHPAGSHDDVNCKECGKSCAYAPMETESAKARVCDKCKKGHYKETEDAGAHWFTCDQCGSRMSVPKNAAKECPDCHGTFEGAEGEKCPTCGRFAVQKTASNSTLCEHCKDGIGDRYDATCGNCKNSGHKGHQSSCPKCNNKTAAPSSLIPGTRVRVSDGSGLASGIEGTITTRWEFTQNVKTNGRGVPNIDGHYKPVDWTREVPIKLDDGSYMTMFKNRVIPVEQKTALKPALPPQILNRRNEVNASGCDQCAATMINGVFCHETGCPNKKKKDRDEDMDVESSLHKVARVVHRTDVNASDIGKFKCAECGQSFDTQFSLNNHVYDETFKKASLNKVARVVHRDDGWHVLSEKGKNLGGPYKSKDEAVKRLRQVEYFKHHGSIRPFSKKADVVDPYATLTNHVNDMRSRMTQVQEKIQTLPAAKTAADEDTAPEMDLAALFADLTQGIELLETKLGGDDIEPELHKGVEELENKLWTLEEKLGLTPKLSEHEKEEPEHKEIVKDIEKKAAGETMATKCKCMHLYKDHMDNDECSFESCDCKKFKKTASAPKWLSYKGLMLPPGFDLNAFKEWSGGNDVDEIALTDAEMNEFQDDPKLSLEFYIQDNYPQFAQEWETKNSENQKHADQVTDETIVTNDPNAVIDPTAVTPPPVIKNVQPTDDSNLVVPVAMPTSPLPKGQHWQFDTQFNKFVAMPDNSNQTI